MSDRPCNLCELKRWRRQAAKEGKVITTRPGTREVAGAQGTDAFEHPPDREPVQADWIAWFMELPDECAC